MQMYCVLTPKWIELVFGAMVTTYDSNLYCMINLQKGRPPAEMGVGLGILSAHYAVVGQPSSC